MAEQRRRASGGSKRGSSARAKKASSTRKRAGASKSTSRAAATAAQKKHRESAPTRGTAPSAPDIRKLHVFEPSDHAKAHEPSEVDAMGKNKRREVIGHSYGPSRKSQLMFFGIVAAALVILVGGGKMVADKADEPPETNPDAAPWAQSDAPQRPALRPE